MANSSSPDSNSSRKRARMDSDSQDAMMTPSPNQLTRDPLYYKETGDCTVQVGNVLFKIHKERLSNDTSAFQDMFGFPQGAQSQGDSDLNPICLPDNIDQFRALCWALYALPTDIIAQTSSAVNIPRLIDLATISNKYSFTSYEKWALDTIASHFSPKGKDSDLVPDIATIGRLVEVAAICGRNEMLKVIMPQWIDLVKQGKGPVDPLLRTIEKHSLKSFQCQIYMWKVKQLSDLADRDGGSASPAPSWYNQLDLDDLHLTRVLAGFTSLTLTMARIEKSLPPVFPQPASCSQHAHQRCLLRWRATWQAALYATSALSPATSNHSFGGFGANPYAASSSSDASFQYAKMNGPLDIVSKYENILTRISAVQSVDGTFGSNSSGNFLPATCRNPAIQAVERLRNEAINSLPQHFLL